MTSLSSRVGDIQSALEAVRTRLRTTHLNAVRNVLTDDMILGACRQQEHEYRDRILGPVVTALHFVAAALWPNDSFPQAWEVFGSERVWLVTSLLDCEKYPADEIAQLYLERWRIEIVFRQLTITCGADVLRSKTVSGVRKEIAARVMAVDLTRIIMIDAATKHDRVPSRLSFSAALCKAVVPERPGRDEPRAATREKKDYPRLKGSRAEWRRQNEAA